MLIFILKKPMFDKVIISMIGNLRHLFLAFNLKHNIAVKIKTEMRRYFIMDIDISFSNQATIKHSRTYFFIKQETNQLLLIVHLSPWHNETFENVEIHGQLTIIDSDLQSCKNYRKYSFRAKFLKEISIFKRSKKQNSDKITRVGRGLGVFKSNPMPKQKTLLCLTNGCPINGHKCTGIMGVQKTLS